jgi:hypothetical protein
VSRQACMSRQQISSLASRCSNSTDFGAAGNSSDGAGHSCATLRRRWNVDRRREDNVWQS